MSDVKDQVAGPELILRSIEAQNRAWALAGSYEKAKITRRIDTLYKLLKGNG